MSTLEDVYNSLGYEIPFSVLTGDLTRQGLQARKELENILGCLSNLGVIVGWSQDVLDQLEGTNI